jgi:hypothetical protein
MRLDKYSVNLQEELGNPDFINSMNYGALTDEDRERLIMLYNNAINVSTNAQAGLYYVLSNVMNPIRTNSIYGTHLYTSGPIYSQFLGGEFPLVGAPEPLRNMFDYNGDGIIGANDLTLMYLIGNTIFEHIENGGEWNEDTFLTPAEYQARWQEINELYGLDLPNPDGFIGVLFGGEGSEDGLIQWSDAEGRDGRFVAGGSIWYPGSGGGGGFQVNYGTGTYMINGEPTEPGGLGSNNQYGMAGKIINFFDTHGPNAEYLIAMYGFDGYMDVVREFDYNGDGLITGGAYVVGSPDGNPFEDLTDSWLLWIYFGMLLKIRRANNPDFDFQVTGLPIPPNGFRGMLDSLRNELALTGVNIKDLVRENDASAAFYQILFDFFNEYGLNLPGSPDDQRGDEDTIGYEELLDLLANYGEGGANFQDLLQLLSDYGQPVPPPPPETGTGPRP